MKVRNKSADKFTKIEADVLKKRISYKKIFKCNNCADTALTSGHGLEEMLLIILSEEFKLIFSSEL